MEYCMNIVQVASCVDDCFWYNAKIVFMLQQKPSGALDGSLHAAPSKTSLYCRDRFSESTTYHFKEIDRTPPRTAP